jgi:hypothetical protein
MPGDDKTPQLPFSLVPLTGDGFPVEADDSYKLLFDQAVSGGAGTRTYLSRLAQFSSLATTLKKKGDAAFSIENTGGGTARAVASDANATMQVGVALHSGLQTRQLPGADIPVRGVATIRLSLPAPRELSKIVSFGVSLAEIPAGIAVGDKLIEALFRPLLNQLTRFVQTSVERWLAIDVGEGIDGLGEDIASAAADAAEEVGAETAEVVVEEAVVAEVAIDLAAAAPPLAVLGVLIAIPILIEALSKQFELHLEIDNQTDHDLTWSLTYQENGSMTAQPASNLLPRMGKATDAWGDQTDLPVIYQANFSAMNKSGYEGTGIALRISPADLPASDLAVLISIPWGADNALWVGDVGPNFDWERAYSSKPVPKLRYQHGNMHLSTVLAIDALSGQGDVYHCVLRVAPL